MNNMEATIKKRGEGAIKVFSVFLLFALIAELVLFIDGILRPQMGDAGMGFVIISATILIPIIFFSSLGIIATQLITRNNYNDVVRSVYDKSFIMLSYIILIIAALLFLDLIVLKTMFIDRII
jgi:hypothetical protein